MMNQISSLKFNELKGVNYYFARFWTQVEQESIKSIKDFA